MPTQVFSGARARLLVDGKRVGFAGNASGEETIDYEPVDVIDRLEVLEYVPVGYRVTFSADVFRVPRQSLKDLEGVSIYPKTDNILTDGALTIAIEDRQDPNLTIMTIQNAKAITKTLTVGARSIAGQNISFNGIRMLDETESA